MTNARLFEIAMLKRGKSKQDIANLLKCSLQTIYNKLNNKVDFKGSEIIKICEYLKLTNADKERIFFAKKVD